MKAKGRSVRWGLPVLLAVLLIGAMPANGQLANLLSAFTGGTQATPAATPAASSTPASTPASTPSSTPASTPTSTPSSTPSSTPASATPSTASDATADPPASTTSSSTAPTTSTSASTTSAAPGIANPPAVVVLLPGVSSSPSSALSVASTPQVTVTPPPAPPPPVPIVINPGKLVNALPADELQPLNTTTDSGEDNTGIAGTTAADLVVQVSGSGVTPFDVPQQTILLRAAASVLTTVSLGDLRILYVTSAATLNSNIFGGRRLLALPEEDVKVGRQLLDDLTGAQAAALKGDLYNEVTVILQANCSSAAAVPATLAEMQSILQNGLLASALQSYNATSWGISLLSLTSVDPSTYLDTKTPCKKKLGTFCLDGTSLSVSAAEAIIGIGCFVVLMILCIPCVYLEWSRRSGRMVELEPTPETPKSPMQKVQAMYNNMINNAKQLSPMHRKNSNAQNPFRETPRSETPTVGTKPNDSMRPAINIHASSRR